MGSRCTADTDTGVVDVKDKGRRSEAERTDAKQGSGLGAEKVSRDFPPATRFAHRRNCNRLTAHSQKPGTSARHPVRRTRVKWRLWTGW